MKIWPIFKKEMRLYFTSPVAYVILAIFLVIAGYFFYSIFAFFTMASMQAAMNPQMARDLTVTDSVMRPLFSNVSTTVPKAISGKPAKVGSRVPPGAKASTPSSNAPPIVPCGGVQP